MAQKAVISGTVRSEQGRSLPFITVSVLGGAGTITANNGTYQLEVPAEELVKIVFSSTEYLADTIRLQLAAGETRQINRQLIRKNVEIGEVQIEEVRRHLTSIHTFNPKIVTVLPSPTGDFTAILKTLPGVAAGNELSSQYSVRGGNFDENLVYVNDIEVYRPFLVRSGQQEGLSFVNGDMVSDVQFSAGGFEAKYGDKMSSVLDIKYRKPTEFGATVSGSLLGGAGHVEGMSDDSRFTHNSGIRYKTTQYLLNTLETSGEYKPSFTDFQTYLTYDLTTDFEISFLGNYAQNSYHFIPETRSTDFGTIDNALNFTIYFDGQEVDAYTTYFGAVAGTYRPKDNLQLKFITSAYHTTEEETFDILGEYYLNELDRRQDADTYGDSLMNLGIGRYLDHARNYLDVTVSNFYHKGYYSYSNDYGALLWGVKYQSEWITDELNEWKMLDSAGYSLPYSDSEVLLSETHNSRTELQTNRVTSYIQNTYTFDRDKTSYTLTAGIRAHYWDFTEQITVSPRLSFAYQPYWARPDSGRYDVLFKLAAGYYHQPPFYKELRDHSGNINYDIKAQRSIHFVLGADYNFKAWNRPFKFVTELYYKKLDNLIPFELDNVRLRYYANEIAKGYTAGIDLKVNGEFVKGVDSWFSLSFMESKEDVENDGHGYIERPTSQLLNVGMFFQDYFPGNDSYKMHLNFLYGSHTYHGPPNTERYLATFRVPSYLRVDIGFSKILKREGQQLKERNPFRHFKSIWVTGEVFNLLNIINTVSYEWVKVVPNAVTSATQVYDQYAVPNRLTNRLFNIRLILKL